MIFVSPFSAGSISCSVLEILLFTSGLNFWFVSVLSSNSLFFWIDSVSCLASAGLLAQCFSNCPSDSFSFSDSPDEVVPSGRWLFFLCFFLLFFLLFLECLWRRCVLLSSSFGDFLHLSGFLGLLSLLCQFRSFFLLVLLSLSLLSPWMFSSLSLFLCSLPLSLLLFFSLSCSLSPLLLLDLSLLLLGLRPDLDDRWWEALLSWLLSLLLLLRLSPSLLLWDLSDLSGLLLQWRCLHKLSPYRSECLPSLRLPLTLRSGDKCRSLSASQNSLPGFRNTCRKLQCFPLGHFCLSNNPESGETNTR